MQTLNLKPNHKAVRDYYAALGQTQQLSGHTNDPSHADDQTCIVRLIKQIITVSLETVNIVQNLPPLEILETAVA
ncbi:MAG TPA: hypothetical protein PLD25_23365 [Chloroflexota bacterium]|nr:hypothetical protein [Chloroflexota bacterium]